MVKRKTMTDNTEELIDETEAQLLDAMSIEELPVYKAYAGQELAVGQTKAKMYDIVEAIKTVFDPEIPINVYDLGLIYKINQEDCGNMPNPERYGAQYSAKRNKSTLALRHSQI